MIKKGFKRWSHKIHNEDIEVTFSRAIINVGNSLINNCGIIVEVVVKLAFVYQLGMFGVNGLNLHSNFKIGLGVDCLVDFSKGSLINLPDDFEILADLL